LGAQAAVGGGGRYDGLVADLGGPDVPGIGFAFGVERMVMAAESAGVTAAPAAAPEFFVAPVGPAAAVAALDLARRLRGVPRVVELGASDRKLKAQLKIADRAGARFVIILGDAELARGRASVRDLRRRQDHADVVDLAAAGGEIVRAVERTSDREA
jgi:histidyl-tRNA synthetase